MLLFNLKDNCEFLDDGSREVILKEETEEVSYVKYSLNENVLSIIDIQRTTTGRYRLKKKNRYYGTEVFNILLLHLKERDESFSSIKGTLSHFDAKNNWKDSISFYYDFVNHIFQGLGYSLKFVLYDNLEDMKNNIPVHIPDKNFEKIEFINFIESFIDKHTIYKYDAYFKFFTTNNSL